MLSHVQHVRNMAPCVPGSDDATTRQPDEDDRCPSPAGVAGARPGVGRSRDRLGSLAKLAPGAARSGGPGGRWLGVVRELILRARGARRAGRQTERKPGAILRASRSWSTAHARCSGADHPALTSCSRGWSVPPMPEPLQSPLASGSSGRNRSLHSEAAAGLIPGRGGSVSAMPDAVKRFPEREAGELMPAVHCAPG